MITIEDVRSALAALGFRKRAGDIYTLELEDPDVIGVIGFNRASRSLPAGVFRINPIVGVRHEPIERTVAELQRTKFHQYTPSTVNTPIGYVMPDNRYMTWTFGVEVESDSGLSLVDAVEQYAIAFFAASQDLRSLCALLEEGVGYDHQIVYRHPIARMLLGDSERADELVQNELSRIQGHQYEAAVNFRAFADEYRQWRITDGR